MNTGGEITHAGTGTLAVTASTLDGAQGVIQGAGSLQLRTGTTNLDGATLDAQRLDVQAASLSTKGATILQRGTAAGQITVAGAWDNTNGVVWLGGDATLYAGSLTNAGGTIASAGKLGLTTGSLANRSGTLAAGTDVVIASGALDNTLGTIGTQHGNVQITATGAVTNDSGVIQASGDVTLTSTSLSNAKAPTATDGGWIIGRNVTIDTQGGQLTNTQGTIAATGTLAVGSGDLANGNGFIGSVGVADLHAAVLNNTSGSIVSQATLNISASSLGNTGGQIQSVGDQTLQVTGTLTNTSGLLRSASTLNEQSGLHAGDRGFDVAVKGDTTLVGGAITSTDKAVQDGKNSFATGGALTTTDIQNKAEYKGDGFKASATIAGGGPDQKPDDPPPKNGQAFEPTRGGSAGVGEDSKTVASITTAGISGVAGDAGKRTGDQESGIAPIFDKNKVQTEIDAQIKVTEQFGPAAAALVGIYAQKEYEELKDVDPAEAAKWAEGGVYRVALHAVVGGLSGGIGGFIGVATSQGLIDFVGQQIAELDIPIVLKQALAAAAGTAIGAVFGDSAGAATGLNATVNNYLTVANLQKKELTTKQQQELSLQNNAKVEDACLGGTREACGKAIANAADDINDLRDYKQQLQQQLLSTDDASAKAALAAQIAGVDKQIASAGNAISVGLMAIKGGNLDVKSMSPEELVAIGFALDIAGAAAIKTAESVNDAIVAARQAARTEQARQAQKVENNNYADGSNPPDWTPGKPGASDLNLATHWVKHGSEFPDLTSANDYYRATLDFVSSPPNGTLFKTKPNGDVLMYDPASNTFGVKTSDGIPKTMFKPSQNIIYWNKQ